MRKNYVFGLFLSFFILIGGFTQAQVERCATNTIHQQYLADPAYRATFERMEAELQLRIAEKMANAASQRTEATVYQIPLVVHVIHTGGAVGTIYNPTDAVINSMITKINSDFRNLGGAGTDVEIEFVLAKRTPTCGASTGINRVDGSGLANYTAGGVGTGGATDAAVKALSLWPNTDYYNIWIVSKIDGNDGTAGAFTAGYATFPGGNAATDGTVILATQVNVTSATMTHELGHAFKLQHTFHKAETGDDSANATDCPLNANCATQGDLICDTDPHAYMLGTCSTTNCGGVAATTLSNYMSYCDGQDRFSPNQVTRMRTSLETERGGLISSLGATALGGTLPPVACTPTATGTFSGFGVTRFNLNTLNLTSGRSNTEGNYVDRICTQGTTIAAGATHPLKIETSVNSHNVKVYIDYNKNGVFTDTGEEVASGISTDVAGTFTYITSYTAPTTGITFNEALRLRVVSSFVGDGTATSCAVFRGQAEDYSVTIQNVVAPTVTLGAITPTAYCAGATISVPFTTTGTFNGGNTFTAELSDATGNFATITATANGTTPISLTAPATAGIGYKVRVRASNPATTSNSSADITVNALPTNLTVAANPTSVTTGNSSNIQVPTSQTGVNYQLQVTPANTNVGTAVAGTGGTISLPTGNLVATTSFRVVATNATTTCSRTLNTVAVTVTGAAPTITLGAITPTAYCAGATISVPFTTTGTYNAGNTFTAELSDATGNFATITATANGTTPISLTAPTTAGTGYKVRVRASDPATTSNSSADITVNALPTNLTVAANPTSVTSGNSSNIQVPTSQVGVNYQLQVTPANTNVGTAVAGTGGTISLPTGNLAATTSFRVVATNATTTCSRTLNTVSVGITGAAPTIVLGAITPTAYCAGATISVPFTTTGTFNGGNTFTAELSDATGNFATITATANGTTPISLTAPATTGTGYKVRVRASDPATTSNSSADITVNALPTNLTVAANPTSVTTGNSSNIEVPTSQTGVNYQLQVTPANTNVGTAVAGTGGTISLPTGNLTVATSFRVVATNATTTCSRTLNTVSVGITGAAPTIVLGAITPTAYCVGSTISVPFTTTGTYNAGNTFTAELSDATGNFGTITATANGTTPISLTAPTTAGTGYKVRVRASNPATTSGSSADITVNALPTNLTVAANPTSVTSGTSSNIEVPTSQTGVNYQLQVTPANTNVGTAVAGTGGTISLPTGNLTVATSFRVVATNTTTTCSRTLNTVTVIMAGAGGGGGGGGGGSTSVVASPTNFRAVGTSTSQIDLTWTAVSGATGYILTSGNTQVASLPAGTVSYNHTGLTADTSYPYSLVAVNGSVSSTAVQTTGRTLPNAPTVVSVVESCGSGSVSIVLSGTGSSFRIYTAQTAGTLVAEISTSTYTTPVLTQSTTYFISTVSNGNESARTQVEAVVTTPITATISEGSSVRSCNATTTLTANEVTGATYTWLVNGIAISGATTNTLEVNRTSSYQVRITKGSCSVTSSFTSVTVNYAPVATISQGIATSFCESGVISASEVANATYEWSLNGTVVGSARQLSVSNSGSYTLTVTESGCSATDVIQVTVTSLPSVSISSSEPSFCAGDKVTLTANDVSGVRYDWSRNGRVVRRNAGSSIEVTSGGEYSVTISQNNCSISSTSINVERINEEKTYLRTTQTTLFVEPANSSVQITNIVWFLEGTESTTFSGETITPTESGNYYAVVTYSTGCTYRTRSTYFRVFVPVIVTGEENDLAKALRIYPNPSTGSFRIELGDIQEEVTITVVDALGRLIKTEIIPIGTSSYNLSLAKYPSGVYTVQLKIQKGMVIKKLIIE